MGDKTACYCWELVRSNMSPPTFRDTRNNVTTSDNAREGGWISRLIGKYISPSDIERMMNRAQCNSSINEIEIIASVLEKLEKIDLKIKTEDSVSEIMRYMIGVLIRAHDPSKENSKKEILKLLAKSNIFNQLLEKVEKSLNLIKECMDNVDDTAFEKFRRDDDVKVDTGRVAINNSIEFIGNYKSRRLLYEKESKKEMDDFENILKERGLTLEDARDTHNECFKGQYFDVSDEGEGGEGGKIMIKKIKNGVETYTHLIDITDDNESRDKKIRRFAEKIEKLKYFNDLLKENGMNYNDDVCSRLENYDVDIFNVGEGLYSCLPSYNRCGIDFRIISLPKLPTDSSKKGLFYVLNAIETVCFLKYEKKIKEFNDKLIEKGIAIDDAKRFYEGFMKKPITSENLFNNIDINIKIDNNKEIKISIPTNDEKEIGMFIKLYEQHKSLTIKFGELHELNKRSKERKEKIREIGKDAKEYLGGKTLSSVLSS